MFLVSVEVWCALALLLIPYYLAAQNALDSTLRILQKAEQYNSGEQYNAKLLNDIARGLFMRSPDSAFTLSSRALALALAQRDTMQIAVAHNVFGLIYLDKALYDKALQEQLFALRIFEVRRDSLNCAKLYSNIGNIYGRQQQFEKALESYNLALRYHNAMGNKKEFISANTNIGFTYWKQGKYDLALEYHYRSLALATAIHHQFSVSIAHINLGATYIGKKIYDSAETHLQQALILSREQTNNRMLCITLHYLAEVRFATKQFAPSVRLAKESLELARRLKAREEELKTLKLLADIHFATGDYKESTLRHREYAALKDSLFNLENTKALAALQALYTTAKKDNEIGILKRDADIQALQISRQTTLRNSLLAGLALLSVLAVILANRYQLKKNSEEHLRQKNTEIVRQQRILEDQATEIELSNSELHETNLKLVDANHELQTTYQEIVRQQKILEEQAADIEETNTRLQETNIALERLNREKNEFLGIVAHDLKNPLGSIIVSVNNLQRYRQSMTLEQQQKLYERILEVSSRMRSIIEDILDVNAVETGVMNIRLESVNVSRIAAEIVESYRAQAEKKLLTIQSACGQDLAALADASKVHEVLDNLISNAVKYSPPRKNIWIRIKPEGGNRKQDGMKQDGAIASALLRVEVQDEGPGISAEDMKKLFGKFTRLSARPTGGEHSTGLGLSIVKKMVEAMNGRVWCESELGKGATFIVELPKI